MNDGLILERVMAAGVARSLTSIRPLLVSLGIISKMGLGSLLVKRLRPARLCRAG